jgi:RNA polymerase sigma factor (TIGR02999 family)
VPPSRESEAPAADDDVTGLLLRLGNGDADAFGAAFERVYNELCALARHQLEGEAGEHTLATSALVHEVFLTLVDQTRARYEDRMHFLAMAAIAMRRILVDHARHHARAKRGGAMHRVPFAMAEASALPERAEALVELDASLDRLRTFDVQQARVVELRFFGGLTEDEVAAVLGISTRTVKREWARARAWLYADLQHESEA